MAADKLWSATTLTLKRRAISTMKLNGKTFVWSPVISSLIYQLNTDQVNWAAQANKFLSLPTGLWSRPSNVVYVAITASYELIKKSAIIKNGEVAYSEIQGTVTWRDNGRTYFQVFFYDSRNYSSHNLLFMLYKFVKDAQTYRLPVQSL